MSVKERIYNIISEKGYIDIDEFMTLALSSHDDSYYRSKDPLGENSDFITAPEISQMFGEMIGVWAIDSWTKFGRPKKFNLVEFGSGRGSLLKDLLRIAKIENDFLEGANIHIIDINEELIKIQKENLKNYNVKWVKSIDDISDAPTIIIANEFFDALPIKQYVKIGTNLHERIIVENDEGFLFAPKASAARPLKGHPNIHNGDIIEESPESIEIISKIASFIEKNKGSALIIDYGYDIEPDERGEGQYKDTLQAIKEHKFTSVFDNIGSADITAHVDFHALKSEASKHKIDVLGTISQANLLLNLGIDLRLQSLQMSNPELSDILAKQYNRLISDNQMGSLFKAIILNNFLTKSFK